MCFYPKHEAHQQNRHQPQVQLWVLKLATVRGGCGSVVACLPTECQRPWVPFPTLNGIKTKATIVSAAMLWQTISQRRDTSLCPSWSQTRRQDDSASHPPLDGHRIHQLLSHTRRDRHQLLSKAVHCSSQETPPHAVTATCPADGSKVPGPRVTPIYVVTVRRKGWECEGIHLPALTSCTRASALISVTGKHPTLSLLKLHLEKSILVIIFHCRVKESFRDLINSSKL